MHIAIRGVVVLHIGDTTSKLEPYKCVGDVICSALTDGARGALKITTTTHRSRKALKLNKSFYFTKFEVGS